MAEGCLTWLSPTNFCTYLPLLFGGAVILLQYILIFELQKGSFQAEESGVSIGWPFSSYLSWVPSLVLTPISLVISLMLPLATLMLYREAVRYKPFTYSLALLGAGILLSALVVETGPRAEHGNFFWQNIICLYLNLMTIATFLLGRWRTDGPQSGRMRFLVLLFVLHAASGVLYIGKMLLTKSYF